VGVLGYGQTGRAAVGLLRQCGHRVRISDAGPVTLEAGVVADGVETGGHTVGFLDRCDLIVASPGVPGDSEILTALHRRSVPVMSALEMAYQLGVRAGSPAASSLIAVTGTVGKRTTVELMQHLFETAGQPLIIGGNRGKPLAELLMQPGGTDPIALAVSSFQLEPVVHFCPHVSVLLNIDEAHLDRHRTIAEYVRIKSRIFMNHGPNDALILPFDDPRLRPLARKHQGRTYYVSSRQPVDRGAWLVEGQMYLNVGEAVERLGPASPPYPENLLASVLAARLYGLPAEGIAEGVRHFDRFPE